ncbi:protein synthesis inhibitor I-like [Phragmites australis]|uniref:protein synthesis inhibitor I-like n=1 Tax=Phragmites australis TaxID=29695 RepID=UPI002D79B482|nr:protein synthesis inhibitor I-like [Phragmites australis]
MKIAALLLLALLLVVQADDDNVTEWKPNQTTVTLALDVSAPANRYRAFMSEMERQLARQTTRPHIEKRPVLGVQKPNREPDCWIYVTLKGHGESTLALRADNVYLTGFKTQGGSWYAFKKKDHLIRGSTALSFEDDYKSLTGGGYKELENVVVGKKSAQEALAILANYKQGSIPEQEIKKALTRFILMLCEAGRFAPIRAAVIAAWDEEGGKVDKAGVELTVKWRTISCALLVWDKTHKWGSIKEAKEIETYGDPKMTSPKAAAENVYFILRPTDTCSDEKPPRM